MASIVTHWPMEALMRHIFLFSALLFACGEADDNTSDTAGTTTDATNTETTNGNGGDGGDGGNGGQTGTTGSGGVDYEVDPDVQTYVPDSFPPVNPVRIVFMGDSITAGAGASGSEPYTSLLMENDPGDWPDHMEEDLKTVYPSVTEVINLGTGGATTTSMKNNQMPELQEILSPPVAGETIVVFTIGGNDLQTALTPFSDPESIATRALNNIEEMVQTLTSDSVFPDGVFVYMTNVYEPSDGTGKSSCFFGVDYSSKLHYLDVYNGALIKMGIQYGFSAVDLRGHFLGHGMNNDDSSLDIHHPDDPSRWFAGDCIHPNARGHHELRRLLVAAIRDMPLALEP